MHTEKQQADTLTPSVSKKHLYSLDLLRGFAALSVCLLHFTFGVLPNLRDTPLTPLFSWGYLGVDIFFIISGFVIPLALDRSGYTLSEFGPFMGKRILRICPPSYVAMFVTIGQRLALDFLINHNRTYTADLTWFQVLNNMLYTVPYTSSSWLNGVFWTLAVEFQYYIIIGLSFAFFKRGWMSLVVFAALFNVIDYIGFAKNIQFFEYNLLFVLGILTWMKYSDRISNKKFVLFFILSLVAIFFRINYLVCIYSLLTVVCILYYNVKNVVFSFFGKISYSLYLLHTVAGTTVEAFWTRIFPVGTLMEKIVLLVVCLAGTIIASYLFHLLIEVPFMRLAEQFFKKKPATH